jgi:hypothetical protein
LPLPEPTRHDFGLKVEMLGARHGPGGILEVDEGQKVQFRIEVDRDAYVGLWTIDAEGTIVQLFPSRYERDHLVRARQQRIIPAGNYGIFAEIGKGSDQVRVVAASQFWDPIRGQENGPFWIFKTAEERANWDRCVRGLVLKPLGDQGKLAVAEDAIRYEVKPARNPVRGAKSDK